MHIVQSVVLSTALAIFCGCNNKPSPTANGSAAPTAATPTAATPTAASGDVSAASVSLEFTGKYEKGDNPADEYPVFKVTNNSSRKLHFIQGWHYYYDKDKKQLGRDYAERTVGTLEAGQSQEFGFGSQKANQPKGTEKIEAVFVGGNFADKVEFKGDVKALAPEQRPMKGG